MQDKDKQDNSSAADPVAAASAMAGKAVQGDFIQKIVEKIKSSENILIALSRDPSVDEIAAAIGLTVFLDGMQKHATAIYSGRTPENLGFLQPDATFETNTDSLQDFIIALSKEKADHLRYKLEGDFVKVFITPYKANITEDDLTFSHGDYNVDFVIAINVPSAGNLDEALREHGRIMHDASAVNITTGQPGRFGEIEWSNPVASSLCEMVTELVFAIQGSDETPLDKDVATALLAGIVAATNRFSNERTNPDTLSVASKLMSMGADQQLIASNIKGNEIIRNTNEYGIGMQTANAPKDKTNLAVEHGGPEVAPVRNPYAEGGPLAGTVGNAQNDTTGSAVVVPGMPGVSNGDAVSTAAGNAATAGVNPAAQVAPNLDMTTNPAPASITSETQNVTPDSTVVQPVIPNGAPTSSPTMILPGVPTGAPAPTAAVPVAAGGATSAGGAMVPNTPKPSTAPSSVVPSVPAGATGPSLPPVQVTPPSADSGSRPMATSEPAAPTTKQVGSTLQPPAPAPRKSKNYAEMMEEALAEPLPGNGAATMSSATSAGGVSAVSANNAGGVSTGNVSGASTGGTSGAPTSSSTMVLPGVPTSTPAPTASVSATPVMEPVANPNAGGILPPPPAPSAGMGMMPPVLPPVQVPPEMTK